MHDEPQPHRLAGELQNTTPFLPAERLFDRVANAITAIG